MVFQGITTGPAPEQAAPTLMEGLETEENQQDREWEGSKTKCLRSASKNHGQSKEPAPRQKDVPDREAKEGTGRLTSATGSRGQDRTWGSAHGVAGDAEDGATEQLQDLEEKIRLVARVALRHEDELSQLRKERVFVLTFETKKGSVLDRLYELAMIRHTKKEKNEVDSPPPLMLFLGLGGQRGALGSDGPAGTGHFGGGSPRTSVKIPEMESSCGEKGAGAGSDPHAPIAGGGDPCAAGEHHIGAKRPGSVPCDAQAGRKPGRKYHHLLDGSRAAARHGAG